MTRRDGSFGAVIRTRRLMDEAGVSSPIEALRLVLRLRMRHPHIVAANLRELRKGGGGDG